MTPIIIIQSVLAILLIAAILIQQRGTGIGSSFGGNDSAYSTRRGAEKFIFISTIVLAILFFAVSVARILL